MTMTFEDKVSSDCGDFGFTYYAACSVEVLLNPHTISISLSGVLNLQMSP